MAQDVSLGARNWWGSLAWPRGAPAASIPERFARLLLPMLVVIIIPLVEHAPEVLGWLSCNPVYSTSGLRDFPFGSLLGGICFIDGNAGVTVQSLGGLSAQQWLSGTLPWWNHFSGAGLPLASEMQSSSFFMPMLLLLHFFNGMLYLKISLQILSGVFTVLFLREFGLSAFAAVLGGVFFELNGTFTWFSDAPIHPIAFLPLLMFGIERCRRLAAQGSPGGQASVAVAIGYSIVAGFPEVAFANGILALLWALARHAGPAAVTRAYALKIVIGGTCGLLLASPALVPFLHDLQVSTLGFHGYASLEAPARSRAVSILLPSIFGPPFSHLPPAQWALPWGSLGPGLAFLAVLGYAEKPFDRLRLVLVGWFLFCVGGAYHAPVIDTVRGILPGLREVVFGRYVGPSAEFAAAILAAMALDAWRRGVVLRRTGLSLGAVALIAAAVWHISRHQLADEMAVSQWDRTRVIACVVAGGLIVAFLRLVLRELPTPPLRLVAAAVLAGETLAAAVTPILAGTPDLNHTNGPVGYLQAHAGFSRTYSVGGGMLPNYGAFYGVSQINEMYVPLPNVWNAYVGRLTSLETPVLFKGDVPSPAIGLADFKAHRTAFTEAAVAYLMVPQGNDPLANGHDPLFEPVFEDGRTRIYHLPDAAPYFSWQNGSCTLDTVSRDSVIAHCPAPARLLRREMAFEGWHVQVNARSVKLHTAGIFQSVDLPQGTSVVRWRYAPPNAWPIAAAFAAGVILLAAFMGADMRVWRRPRRRGAPGPDMQGPGYAGAADSIARARDRA